VRVFLDTNVLVSAFATRGLCEDLFRLVLADHELLVGEVVLDEFERVLSEKLGVPSPLVAEAVEMLRGNTVVPRPEAPAEVEMDDRDDLWVIGSAIEARADVLVTGDRGILRIADELPILEADPRGFWEMLRATGDESVHESRKDGYGGDGYALNVVLRVGERGLKAQPGGCVFWLEGWEVSMASRPPVLSRDLSPVIW